MWRGEPGRDELGRTGYELFVGALSVLSLVNLVLLAALHDPGTQRIVEVLGVVLSLVFLVDFLVRLVRAPSRARYFWREFGWADLLASLPFPQVKILRVFRLVAVVRLLRRYGRHDIGRRLAADPASSALLALLLVGILVLQFGSLAVWRIERDVDGANILTAGDALWYVVETMSTVGYGDQYPVSPAGRVLGAAIIVVGVGIFGTLTGYLANLFLSRPRRSDDDEPEVAGLDEARRQLAQLEELLTQQQAALARLERSLPRT
jgi:voltage-gated potassium channel